MPQTLPIAASRSGQETRHALVRSAEELFARHGIEGPSLREITAAAGVGNKSALNYHFGSREGLVLAILGEHGEVLAGRRAEALDRWVLDGAPADLHRVCDILVSPYGAFLGDGPSQWSYLVIAAAVLDDPRRAHEDVQNLFNDPIVPRVIQMMLDHVDLPDALASERVLVGTSQVISAMATRARQLLAGPSARHASDRRVFVANLVDMMVGALTAPVGQATMNELRPNPDRTHGTPP